MFYIVKLPNTFSIIFIATLDFYEDDELAYKLNLELKISKDLYYVVVKNDADDEIVDNDILHSTSYILLSLIYFDNVKLVKGVFYDYILILH